MSSVNKVIIIGNVGQDPETNFSQQGAAFSRVSIATSEKWKDKQTGQPQERTDWHNVKFSGRLAEIVGEYVRKGSKIYIEGHNRCDKYTDKDGQEKYAYYIQAREMKMLDSRQDSAPAQGYQQQQQPAQQYAQPQQKAPQQYAQPQQGYQPPPQQGMDDLDQDIPF